MDPPQTRTAREPAALHDRRRCRRHDGQLHRGGRLVAQSHAESDRRGAAILAGRGYTTLAETQVSLRQMLPALESARRGLATAERFDYVTGKLRALNRTGEVLLALHRPDEAQPLLEQSLQIETTTGEVHRQIHTLGSLGEIASQRGDHTAALGFFTREVALAQAYKRKSYSAGAWLALAREERRTGDLSAASGHFSLALADATEAHRSDVVMEAHSELARLWLDRRQNSRALQEAQLALALSSDKFPLLRFHTLLTRAEAFRRAHRTAEAGAALTDAAALLNVVNAPEARQEWQAAEATLRPTPPGA